MSGPEINRLLALIVVRRVKVNALYSRLNNAFFSLSLFGGRQHSTTAVDGENTANQVRVITYSTVCVQFCGS